MPCSRTQHGLTRVGLEPPSSGSGVQCINDQATTHVLLVAEWPRFGKKLPARLAICYHYFKSICNTYLFPVSVFRAGLAFDSSCSCSLLFYYF